MIKEFIRKHIDDFTDYTGEVDTLGLIELVQKEFGCAPKYAEQCVYEYLEANPL